MHTAQSGWSEPLRKWTDFAISNPTTQNNPPAGLFYGQLINGKITKREEHGIFKVIWSAFTHWTQTGDTTFISGKYLSNLEQAMSWLETYCWDTKQGAFGFYYDSETPMYGCNDYGYDLANGSFAPEKPYTMTIEGDTVLRIYSYSWNLMSYNSYLMLSAMTQGKKSDLYLNKAKKMETFFGKLSQNGLPLDNVYLLKKAGYKQLKSKDREISSDNGLAYFHYNAPKFDGRSIKRIINTKEDLNGNFLTTVFTALLAKDIEFIDETEIAKVIDYSLPENIRSGKYLPMPYAMTEIFGVEDGDTYHDVRPQYFSIGPFLGTLGNICLKRMPFGIAVRGNNLIEKIENYHYKQALITINYQGKGILQSYTLNGETITHSLQIPENKLVKGTNKLIMQLGKEENKKPLLVYSTMRLDALNTTANEIYYKAYGYGKNLLLFKNVTQTRLITITNSNNVEMTYKISMANNAAYVEFEGKGEYSVKIPSSN